MITPLTQQQQQQRNTSTSANLPTRSSTTCLSSE